MRNNQNHKNLEPACFYLRKSREDQEAESRGEGETLAKHKKALFRLAKDYGVNITKVFEELVSGESIIHRPEMINLLKEVERGDWASVWCMDIDRLGRGKMQDQGLIIDTFKNSNTKIVTPRKIYDLTDEFDEEYTEFETFMARKELKLITRRLQGGRIRSVEEGNYIGTRPPYGYDVQKNGRERILVPNVEQAEVVKLIFDLYTTASMGGNKIAAELNMLGKQTYTGKPWESSTVLFILKNEVYTGRLQWKKREEKKSKNPDKKEDVRTRPKAEWIDVEGKHEPIISREIFNKAQTILKEKYHIPYQIVNGLKNPLAGLIKCDICGASMVFRTYSHQQYPHIICYNPQCSNKSSRFEYVEAQIIESLSIWLDQYCRQYDSSLSFNNGKRLIDIKKQSIQNLKKELQELGKQKDRLHDFLERGVYDENTYLERSQKLSEKIALTEKALFETEHVIRIETKKEQAKTIIIPNIKSVLSVYFQTNDATVKNKMLKSVLEYATYKKEKHQRNNDFTLVIYPRLPK